MAKENYSTFSIEFARQLVCIGSEFETVAKKLCAIIDKTKPAGKISDYKEIILSRYSDLHLAPVYIDQYKREIYPFKSWKSEGKGLEWWTAYQHVKHHRHDKFSEATLKNTLYALASLLLLELYLNGTMNPTCDKRRGGTILLRAPGMLAPRFEQPIDDLPQLPKIISETKPA